MNDPRKVLYLEDQGFDQDDAFLDNLANAGYAVKRARTGDDGVSFLIEEAFDCLVLDIMLPNSTHCIFEGVESVEAGIKILEGLRTGKLGAKADLPVIVISAVSDMKATQKIEDLKPTFYLRKPFSPGRLLDAVNSVLKMAR